MATTQNYIIENLPAGMAIDVKRLLRFQEGITQELIDIDYAGDSAFMFESNLGNLKLNVVISTNKPKDIMCMMNNLYGAKLI